MSLEVLRLQDAIQFQQQAHLREGQTPTKLELGRREDSILFEYFAKSGRHDKKMSGMTSLHGFDYNRMRISVTKDLTGVKVS